MKKLYDVWQQKNPKQLPRPHNVDVTNLPYEYVSHLVHVGQVSALTGSEAIDVARSTMPAFKKASRRTLAAFPIVKQHVIRSDK